MRHAKAVEDDVNGDHSRPLAARGKEDASALWLWLAEQQLLPDLVMCSSATRTRETLAQAPVNLPTLLRDKLYLASAPDMLAQIQNADDAVKTLAVLGHNPGVHGLLALLADDYALERDAERVLLKFPTASCAILTFNAVHWKDLAPHTGLVTHFRWPAEA